MFSKTSKMIVVLVVMLLAFSTLLGACGAAAGGGKTVTIGVSQEPDSLWPYVSTMYTAAVVGNLIYDPLVGVNDKMELYPGLAETVPTAENGGAKLINDGKGIEVTFKLRKGVKWSDGKPLTSKDVKFTLELMLNPKSGAANDVEAKIDKIDTPDDRTVVITYKEIDPNYNVVPYELTPPAIVPEHIIGPLVDNDPQNSPKAEAIKDNPFARAPVGTGPYTIDKNGWQPGVSLTLHANPNYFRGKPKIETVVIRVVPSSDTLLAMLQKGEVDVVTSDALDTKDAPVLDKMAGVKPYYIVGTTWEHIDLNMDDPILKDKNVRQALYYGINRPELIDKIFLGKTKQVDSQIMDWSWAYNPDVPKYAFDPAKAGALLDQAGWKMGADNIREKDGKKLELKFQSTDSPLRTKTTQLIQDQLKQIGVKVDLELMTGQVFFGDEGPLTQRNFQMGEYAWVGGYDPGADQLFSMGSENIPSKENNLKGGNYPGFRNAENDKLLAEGLGTLDQKQRAVIYKKLQLIWQDELPTLPLFARPITSAATDKLINYKPVMNSVGETWNIWEWDKK